MKIDLSIPSWDLVIKHLQNTKDFDANTTLQAIVTAMQYQRKLHRSQANQKLQVRAETFAVGELEVDYGSPISFDSADTVTVSFVRTIPLDDLLNPEEVVDDGSMEIMTRKSALAAYAWW